MSTSIRMVKVDSSANNPSKMDQLVALYSQGGSDVEAARLLNITKRKFYELCEENDNFNQLVEKGRTLSEAWWYEQGRIGLAREKFNSPLFMANMKNRYGWADKVDTGTKDSSEPMNVDQLKGEMYSTLKRVFKKDPELLRRLEIGDESNE